MTISNASGASIHTLVQQEIINADEQINVINVRNTDQQRCESSWREKLVQFNLNFAKAMTVLFMVSLSIFIIGLSVGFFVSDAIVAGAIIVAIMGAIAIGSSVICALVKKTHTQDSSKEQLETFIPHIKNKVENNNLDLTNINDHSASSRALFSLYLRDNDDCFINGILINWFIENNKTVDEENLKSGIKSVINLEHISEFINKAHPNEKKHLKRLISDHISAVFLASDITDKKIQKNIRFGIKTLNEKRDESFKKTQVNSDEKSIEKKLERLIAGDEYIYLSDGRKLKRDEQAKKIFKNLGFDASLNNYLSDNKGKIKDCAESAIMYIRKEMGIEFPNINTEKKALLYFHNSVTKTMTNDAMLFLRSSDNYQTKTSKELSKINKRIKNPILNAWSREMFEYDMECVVKEMVREYLFNNFRSSFGIKNNKYVNEVFNPHYCPLKFKAIGENAPHSKTSIVSSKEKTNKKVSIKETLDFVDIRLEGISSKGTRSDVENAKIKNHPVRFRDDIFAQIKVGDKVMVGGPIANNLDPRLCSITPTSFTHKLRPESKEYKQNKRRHDYIYDDIEGVNSSDV